MTWRDADRDGVVQFLVTEKGFDLDRVKSGLKRLDKSKSYRARGTLARVQTSLFCLCARACVCVCVCRFVEPTATREFLRHQAVESGLCTHTFALTLVAGGGVACTKLIAVPARTRRSDGK